MVFFGSMMNTLRTVALTSEFGWIMSYSAETWRSASARIGISTVARWVSLMSASHGGSDSIGSTLTAMRLTPRRANSAPSAAVRASSVVHTGVKSAGWDRSITQASPAHWWKEIRPSVESCRKSGAMSPSRKDAMSPRLFRKSRDSEARVAQTQRISRCLLIPWHPAYPLSQQGPHLARRLLQERQRLARQQRRRHAVAVGHHVQGGHHPALQRAQRHRQRVHAQLVLLA